MLKKYLTLQKLNLRYFDDAPVGSEGAGGGATGTGDTGSAADSSQQTGSEAVTVYGKDDAENNVDTGSMQNTPPPDSNAPNPNLLTLDFGQLTTPEARKAAFATIKDKFKDEFANDFQGAFNQRFKDHKTLQAKIDQFEPVINALMNYHNAKDVDALFKMVDDDVMADLAEKEGFPSVDKYKDYLNTKRDNEKLVARQTSEQQEIAAKSLETVWRTQGFELQKTIPGFNLDTEIRNPKFVAKLQAGNTVDEAYFLVHKDEILNNAKSETSKQTAQNVVQNIQARKQRIPENGTHNTPAIVRKTDPSTFTDEDMERIAAQVARGAKIRL